MVVAGDGKLAEHKSEGGVKPEVKQHDHAVYTAAGLLRLALAQKYADRHGAFKKSGDPEKDFRFLWVTDFPMFEWDEEGKRWAAAHHPFTSPHEHDMDKLESDPASVRALAYDVVLNGTELGSGSIRIHRQDIQSKIFHALGMTEDEARARFGFFLEALEYGTPPHGGIALGLDRIVMILAGADSLREVIPFPKTARAVDLMVDAPTPVGRSQLKDLHIHVEDLGIFMRDAWLSKLPPEIKLTKKHRRVYQMSNGSRVGIPFAREIDQSWALSLPESQYNVIVLLCQTEAGAVMDFVLPSSVFSPLWDDFNRDDEGRIELDVKRDGATIVLGPADGANIQIDGYLSNYGPLI